MAARDVYVFRHCVRSTSFNVKHTGMDAAFIHAEDFTDLPLPQWGTPENWCTEGGEALIEGTGQQVAGWLASQGIGDFSIVADPVLRDADTAMALLKGLGGTGNVRFDPLLFDTLGPEVGAPLCSASYDEDELHEAVSARLASVPMPSSLEAAVALVTELVGVGRAGSLSSAVPVRVSSGGALEGAPNVIKRVAQQIFYAFASGVAYPLHRNVTTAELYQLIAWQHWCRSVGKAYNAQYATANAALLHAVLSALSPPAIRSAPAPPAPHASIFVGHDGNLDGLATLLDLEWEAPPYVGGASLLPTPPGSALRFRTDGAAAGDARVEVSFVHPVPTTAGGGRNSSGLLESVPLLTLTLGNLGGRAQAALQRYPSAHACFEKAAAHWPPTAAGMSSSGELEISRGGGYILSAVLGALLMVVVLVGVVGARDPRRLMMTAARDREQPHLAMIR